MAKTNLTNISTRVERILELLSLQNPSADIQTNLNRIIAQLETVDYIPYPVSLSTVDVIALNQNGTEVLLGRKPGQTQYQFPGGFRDPKEVGVEAGAREFHEEACLATNSDRMKYIKSIFIDDRRYKNSCHKITTDIMYINLMGEEAKKVCAGDDLEEVRWFNIEELKEDRENIIRDIHIPIFEILLKTL